MSDNANLKSESITYIILSVFGIIGCIVFFVYGSKSGLTLSVYDLIVVGFFVAVFVHSVIVYKRVVNNGR